jgi:hypothetical protein
VCVDHGGPFSTASQRLTLKIMEKYRGSLKSMQIEKTTLQCDPERINRQNSDRHTEQ